MSPPSGERAPFWTQYCDNYSWNPPWWAEISERTDRHGVAIRLLIEHLDRWQIKSLTEKREFLVIGSHGGRWTLMWDDYKGYGTQDMSSDIYYTPHYFLKHEGYDSLCIVTQDAKSYNNWEHNSQVPQGDNLLALMLALQVDEERVIGARYGAF